MTLQDVEQLVLDVRHELVEWRRYFHANPELSFQERHTSQFVYDTLASLPNLELSRPTATSVMARLKGTGPGLVLALRADMDALPIHEENTFPFASQQDGVMHACGHDGHTAMLLATAKILSQMTAQFSGEVRFLFQHAEELFPGGAKEMVEAGVLDGVHRVLGIHLWAPLQVGKIGIRTGALLAAPDRFVIRIVGAGGHAAQPHLTVDSIAVAAQVVTNLQHVVARTVDPLDAMVLSITQIHGGTADNIIPGSVELRGTVRTFTSELRAQAPLTMERVIRGVTEAHGATYEFSYENGYRAVVNDEATTERLRKILTEGFGAEVVEEGVPTMGGEDFSAYQDKVPGTFFFVGAGNEAKGIVYPHHHPRFTVDEAALPIGVKSFVLAVLGFLNECE
ncbi:M20 family metallopeptidase [Alicyclobacillus sp. SP_1]|uniref:M20 family metallopeptidase n=1 Tax=Alicyclobacillus sp. SP_1 TaxID=2942475 RepID=UPI0028060901|nr:M20 family metallopeptidase [Alicyclobacillus sp. SP_1]